MESEFLEALDAYMKKHSLKKSDLSRMTGLPYTTIDGWYKKGPDGIRMSTIRKLSNSLNHRRRRIRWRRIEPNDPLNVGRVRK